MTQVVEQQQKQQQQQQQQQQQPETSCQSTPSGTSTSNSNSNDEHDNKSAGRSTDAFGSFVAVEDFRRNVVSWLTELMKEHGYSRERATRTLLRAIETATVNIASTQQEQQHLTTIETTDDKLFDIMRDYGMGAEQSMRALAVATAIDRMVALVAPADNNDNDNDNCTTNKTTTDSYSAVGSATTTAVKSLVQRLQTNADWKTVNIDTTNSPSDLQDSSILPLPTITQTPVHYTKLVVTTQNNPTRPSSRKRFLDDKTNNSNKNNNNNKHQVPHQTRSRSDSVATDEAVSVKLHHETPTDSGPVTTVPAVVATVTTAPTTTLTTATTCVSNPTNCPPSVTNGRNKRARGPQDNDDKIAVVVNKRSKPTL